MIKKLIVSGAAAALVFGAAVGAFASTNLEISNWSSLSNTVNTSSNTGNNRISAHEEDVTGGYINTGNATSLGVLGNVVNGNELYNFSVNSEESHRGLNISNWSSLSNTVNTSSNTGNNRIHGDDGVDGGTILTGAAGSESVVTNVVNTNLLHDFSVSSSDFFEE